MLKNLTIAILAVVVSSCLWIIWTGSKGPHFSDWGKRDYECIVLTDDVVLKASWTNQVVGTLKKGTILFVPSEEDYRVTDPGDTTLHKLYVSITANMEGKYRKVSQTRSLAERNEQTYNYLDIYPK
jgi:Tfp pilus assembly protein PilW